MSTTLQDLVNRAVFFSTEMQTHFGALIAEAEWEVDFTADPHLSFTSGDGSVLRARPHLLGSESNTQNTWLWGWDNINEFPDSVVGLSHEVRRFGAAEGVDELVAEELTLDEELALRLTLAAKEATGKWAHYPAAAGAGTTVWLLVDAPELTLPEPRVKTTVRALMQGLTQTTVTDHRAALDSYVGKRGIPTADLPEDGLRLLFADGSADLSFDDQRRISNCDMNAPLEGDTADQYAKATGTSTEESKGTAAPTVEDRTPSDATSETKTDTPAEAAAETRSEQPVPRSTDSAATAQPDHDGRSPETDPPLPDTDASVPAAEGQDTVEDADARPTSAAEGAEPSQTESTQPEEPTGDTDATTESAERDEPAEKPKKKGLFSKLFGR